MKPTELRIGNWYMSVKFQTPVQCDLSDLYNLCANSDGAYNDPPIDEMFAPIDLNEEWLKKFGFVRTNHIKGESMYEIKHLAVYAYEGKYTFEPTATPLKYVHQLQNLYFALTGKELEIK